MAALDLITKEDLLAFKNELFAELKKMGIGAQDETRQAKWLKSAEVRKLLSVSPGTLQNLRINGTLRFTKVGGIFYYKLEDIERILETNLSNNY